MAAKASKSKQDKDLPKDLLQAWTSKWKPQLAMDDASELAGLALYAKACQELEQIPHSADPKKDVRIAIVSSFTADKLKEPLAVMCALRGLQPQMFVAPYNQYQQQILDPKSALHAFRPDITILLVDIQHLLGDDLFFPFRRDGKERSALAKQKAQHIIDLSQKYVKTLGDKGIVIVNNFMIPPSSSAGIIDNKQHPGLKEMVEDMNNHIARSFQEDNRVFVFDFEGFTANHGKRKVLDKTLYYLADMKVGQQFMPALAREYLSYCIAYKGLTKKCLVLDLDNTLWGGIVGEDGLAGIRIGPKPPGNAFLEFQKTILGLFERGVILAINSKNNEQDALEVLLKHPDMILHEKHFAATRINWNDKVSNMREIALELNIGTDSIVFMDDSPIERALVAQLIPEVHVVTMPTDPALYAQTLSMLPDFATLNLTEEDKQRGTMYAQEGKRRQLEQSAPDLQSFLKELNIQATFKPADSFTIPRIAQLTQKTNQFNMTTKRYTEPEIVALAKDKKVVIWCVQVVDQFGDNGITGVYIVRKGSASASTKDAAAAVWTIDTFLLSCRILGRNVEESMLIRIAQQARKEGAQKLVGNFIATSKNTPAKGFYAKQGFSIVKATNADNQAELWELDLATFKRSYPDTITIHESAE